MNFRLDEALLTIYQRLGGVWLCVALGLLCYALTARFIRTLGLAVLLLVAAQSWYAPAYFLGRNLRWWVLILVCVRGIVLASRTPRPDWDSGHGRTTAVALGSVAVLSALWSDDRVFTLYTALSFTVSLIAAFWVLWRLMDVEDVIAAACRGAVMLSLLAFGVGLTWCLIADATNDATVLYRSSWGNRVSLLFFNANMSGLLGMILIPPLVAAPRAWLGRLAVLRWPAVACAATAIWLSGSRGSLIGCVVALLILFLYRFGAGALLTVALGLVGMYVVASTSDVEDIDPSAYARFGRMKHIGTLSGRVGLWEEGLDAAQGHMLLGLGWGGSRLLSGADTEDAIEAGHVSHASNLHSTHVQILVDIGVLGLAILWVLILQVLWSGVRLLLVPRSDRSMGVVMVFASFVATLGDTFIHGSVLSTGSPSALIFWSSAVILLRESDRARALSQAPLPAPQAQIPVTAPEPSGRPRLA